MNRRRIAYLLREIADELEREDVEERPRRARAKRLSPRPPGESDELTKRMVRRDLEAKGWRPIG